MPEDADAVDGAGAAPGLSDRGTVRTGARADLLLVAGDPTTDITATRALRAVWCAGQRWEPGTPGSPA